MIFSYTKYQIPNTSNGQAALSLVFLMGGIMLLVGITSMFVVLSFLNSGKGYAAAVQSMALAASGADDALLQLTRNKDFADSYCVPTTCGNLSATVSVAQNSPQAGQATILSTATVFGRQRLIRAVVSINSQTGQVDVLNYGPAAF